MAGEGVEAEAAARPLPSAGLRQPRSAAAFESAGQPRPPAAPGAGGCGGARGGGAGPSGIRSHTLLCPPHKPTCAHPQRDAAFQVGGRMRKRVCDVTSSRASVDFRLRACTPAPAIHLSIHTASLTRAPTHLPSASHASPCPRDRSWALPPCQNAAGGAQGTRRRCRHSAGAGRGREEEQRRPPSSTSRVPSVGGGPHDAAVQRDGLVCGVGGLDPTHRPVPRSNPAFRLGRWAWNQKRGSSGPPTAFSS